MFFVKTCLFLTTALLASGASISNIESLSSKSDGRIVGGFEIDISQVPWQVQLENKGDHFCGASILSEKWIITAAHCVEILSFDKYITARVGSSEVGLFGEEYQAKRVFRHENYNRKTVDYDFALIEVKESIEFNERVRPIALPKTRGKDMDGVSCLVTGWGDTLSGAESTDKLRGVEVPIVNQEKCQNAYHKRHRKITPSMICAGFDKGGKDACQGDSGGPLVEIDETKNATLIGVVSWGYGCAKPNYAGVYSRVDEVLDWISHITGL